MSVIEVPYLKAIENTTDITTEIIRKCEEILYDDAEYKKLKEEGYDFTKVIPYGNPEDPSFQANQVFKFINPNELNIFRRLGKYFTEDLHYFKAKITIDKRDPVNMLTRKGLMKAMYMGKTKLAETFQEYIFILLDGLWKRHKEIMVSEMTTTKKLLEAERERRQDAERINRENLFLREAYASDFDTTSDEKTELAILRRQHMSVYYLYLVDWTHVNSKYWKSRKEAKPKAAPQPKPAAAVKSPNIIEGIDLHSDDEPAEEKAQPAPRRAVKADITAPHKDGIQDPYDAEFLTISDLENNENEEYYFYISHTESDKEYLRLITPIYLDKAAHYNKMVDYIVNGEKVMCRTAYPVNSFPDREIIFPAGDSAATPMSKVYKSTYSKIMSARSRAFIHIHRDELIGAANKKKRQPVAEKAE
jgi:hypothetical protein